MFGYNNGMINPQQMQQRLNYYEQRYPQYGNFQQQAQQQYIPLKGRMVTNIEEVKASTIDMDGSIHFFPDSANGKIYTKQLNVDGTASIKTYEEVKQTENINSEYVTREEYNIVVENLKNMSNILAGIVGGMNYVQSNAINDGGNAGQNESTICDTANVQPKPNVQSSGKNGTGKK